MLLNRLFTAALCLALLLPSAPAQERAPEHHNLADGRLALHGYDPVSYFDEGGGRPRPGKPEHSLDHDGAVYRFASAEHLATFRADPARFEPSHGGWCSYAMALGQQVDIDPLAFRLPEGRLMLFVDRKYAQVDSDWVEDEPALIRQADAHWQELSGEAPRRAPADSWRPYREFNLSEDSLALEGHDPVAYFPEGGGKPRKGSPKHELRHGGVLYRFASAGNLAAFRADPDKYEPRHGGWCSYAMGASGERVEVDPQAFRLTDGQLHLFYNGWFADTREDWDEDTARLKQAADKAWARQVAEAPVSTTAGPG